MFHTGPPRSKRGQTRTIQREERSSRQNTAEAQRCRGQTAERLKTINQSGPFGPPNLAALRVPASVRFPDWADWGFGEGTCRSLVFVHHTPGSLQTSTSRPGQPLGWVGGNLRRGLRGNITKRHVEPTPQCFQSRRGWRVARDGRLPCPAGVLPAAAPRAAQYAAGGATDGGRNSLSRESYAVFTARGHFAASSGGTGGERSSDRPSPCPIAPRRRPHPGRECESTGLAPFARPCR